MPPSFSIGERVLFSVAALGLLTSIIVAFILGQLLESGTNYLPKRPEIVAHGGTFSCHGCGKGFIGFKSSMVPVTLEDLDAYKTGELENSSSTAALFNWSSPAHLFKQEQMRKFVSFLPPTWRAPQVGDSWHIVRSRNDDSSDHQLLSKTYDPPAINDGETAEAVLHDLLSMFHSRPFLHTRSLPRGSVGLLRALNEDWLHIIFRVHAEFQLNEPPLPPFWFTPSHFRGELIISRNTFFVERFHMYVPNSRKLNLDLEWFKEGEEEMMVEIGYLPQMKLELAYSPDSPVSSTDFNVNWTTEMSLEDGYEMIKKKMFPFQEVTYYPVVEAFAKAKSEAKLVHSVLLWGALDDQSC